jgi:hypothetical protein
MLLSIELFEQYRILISKSYTQFIYNIGMESFRVSTADRITNDFGLLTHNLEQTLASEANYLFSNHFQTIKAYFPVVHSLMTGPL